MSETQSIWQKVSLRQGPLNLIVLPGVGGRLWDIQLDGRSILFQNPDLNGIDFDLSTINHLPTRSPQFGFPLWGGEKTWLAPDTDWPGGAPHPVLDSAPYAITAATDRTVSMASDRCPVSDMIIDREIALLSSSAWTVTHRLHNAGETSRVCGIWSVMMLDHPAIIGVPGQQIRLTKVFDEHGGRAALRAEGAIARCDGKDQFKIALDNPYGASLLRVTNDPIWLLCRTPAPAEDAVFAHGQPFEVFNSGDYSYCEAEWHSPRETLAPNETLAFQQTFHVWQGDQPPHKTELTNTERDLMRCMS